MNRPQRVRVVQPVPQCQHRADHEGRAQQRRHSNGPCSGTKHGSASRLAANEHEPMVRPESAIFRRVLKSQSFSQFVPRPGHVGVHDRHGKRGDCHQVAAVVPATSTSSSPAGRWPARELVDVEERLIASSRVAEPHPCFLNTSRRNSG